MEDDIMERLDKILAHLGTGTRKEVRSLIRAGLVTVDDTVITDPGYKIDPEHVKIEVDGQELAYLRHIYIMMNKPSGYITATEDRFQSTVLDLIDPSDWRRDLFPVGRLDKDTEGLLLLTNDGALAHMLTAPKYKVPKKYYFETMEEIDEKRLRTLLEGVDLGDFIAKATSVGPKKEYWLSKKAHQESECVQHWDIRLVIEEGNRLPPSKANVQFQSMHWDIRLCT
jgi:16S rRNA pseudouridine516 synthase